MATEMMGAAGPGRGGRMSRQRKRDAVLRLLRGEDLETVSRALGVTAATLSGWRDAFLAAGEASNVNVAAGQANSVAVNVAPWQFTVAGPDTLVSGEAASYSFTATQGLFANFVSGANLTHATRPVSDTTASPTYTFTSFDAANKRYTFNITTPTVPADSAVYMRMSISINSTDWQQSYPMQIKAPSPLLAAGYIRRPIRVAAGSLTVSFDKKNAR